MEVEEAGLGREGDKPIEFRRIQSVSQSINISCVPTVY